MEHQDRTDFRLPIYRDAPIRHKLIICEPLLSDIDFYNCLDTWVEQVIVGGELNIRKQCIHGKVLFSFKQIGARLLKDGYLYHIKRRYQHSQARKAKIDTE